MWVLKIKLSYEKFLLGNIAHKYQVDMTGYPLNYSKGELTSAGFILGEEKKRKAVLNHIKKNKDKFLKLEVKGDFVIAVTKQPKHLEPIYNPKLIRPIPDFISREGYHIWEIASWDKKPLQEIIKIAKKYHKGKILRLKQEKLGDITFTSVHPELSEKQRKALELAVSEGYYSYPKKTDLHKLAKIMKTSYSTFQEHLKKAEAKLIPNISSRL